MIADYLVRVFTPKSFRAWVFLATFILFVVATVRISSLVYHVPVLGYANSYDMVRIQSCLHLWTDQEGVHFLKGSPAMPVRYYKVDTSDGIWCYYSSELAFASVGVAAGLLLPGQQISIQVFGVVHLLFMLAAVILVNRLLWNAGKYIPMLVNSVIFLVVLSDPAITLYFNTIYAEYAATFFLYLSLAMLYLLLCGSKERTVYLVWYVSLLGLGMSKIQHCILPVTLLLILFVYQRVNKTADLTLAKRSLVISVLPILAVLMQPDNNLTRGINDGNAYNTYVGTVLKYTADQDAFAKKFNINQACQQYSSEGIFWVDLPNTDRNEGGIHPCPEVTRNTRLDLVLYTLSNPGWLVKASYVAFTELRPWIAINFGHIQKQQYGRIWDIKVTLGLWVDKMSGFSFSLMALVYLAGGLALFVYVLQRRMNQPVLYFMGSLSIVAIIVFYVSIFGDGVFDIWKHCNLIFPLMLTFYICVLSLFITAQLNKFVDKP